MILHGIKLRSGCAFFCESCFSVCEETEHLYAYNAYGAAVSEVEVDVLTGEVQILRVDILYDCGQRYMTFLDSGLAALNSLIFFFDMFFLSLYSLNPVIDVGQTEGAFVMGIGYWLTEKLIFDKDSGQLLTHNTWVGGTLDWGAGASSRSGNSISRL